MENHLQAYQNPVLCLMLIHSQPDLLIAKRGINLSVIDKASVLFIKIKT